MVITRGQPCKTSKTGFRSKKSKINEKKKHKNRLENR